MDETRRNKMRFWKWMFDGAKKHSQFLIYFTTMILSVIFVPLLMWFGIVVLINSSIVGWILGATAAFVSEILIVLYFIYRLTEEFYI